MLERRPGLRWDFSEIFRDFRSYISWPRFSELSVWGSCAVLKSGLYSRFEIYFVHVLGAVVSTSPVVFVQSAQRVGPAQRNAAATPKLNNFSKSTEWFTLNHHHSIAFTSPQSSPADFPSLFYELCNFCDTFNGQSQSINNNYYIWSICQ